MSSNTPTRFGRTRDSVSGGGHAGERGRTFARRPLWSLIAGALVAVLLTSGSPASPAFAGANDFGLSVQNGGVTTVAAYSDVVPLEVQISLPAGTAVKAGAVTKLTLDNSLKRTNNGTLPTGATAQSWDERSNTLTVTWGALSAGTVYGATVNSTPSGRAQNTDLFQATAVTTGTATDETPLSQTAVSNPITVTGTTIPGAMPQPQPGQWTANPHNYSLYAGNYAIQWPSFAQTGGVKTAFRNLQVATYWGVPNGADEVLPRSWATDGPQMVNEGVFQNKTVIQNDATARIVAYGAFGGNTVSGLTTSKVTVPADAAPGTYSVAFQILDDVDETGSEKTVVATSYLRVVVKTPAAVTTGYNATSGSNQVAAGDVFDWGQRLSVGAPAGTVKDFTVTLAIPDGLTPRGFSSWFGYNLGSATTKSVQYTTDAVVNASSTWQALPMSTSAVAGAITLADPAVITGIRYTVNNFAIAFDGSMSGASLTLQADDNLALGTVLPLATESITFLDPVAGETTLTQTASFRKNVTIVAAPTSPPQIEASDTPQGNGSVSFGQTYANGNSFASKFFLGSDGATPLAQPYLFVVVPKGMTTTGLSGEVCSPMTWANQASGCSGGFRTTYPVTSNTNGSRTLSDGSTLYYQRYTVGRLASGLMGLQELHSTTTFQLRNLLAGPQNVLVGMGSMTQDSFTVNAARNKNAAYSAKTLSDPASYGSYAGIGDEIKSVLGELGITSDHALMGERDFGVSPSTSVSSVMTIKGSEDAAGIVQGNGAATTRPGGTVNYTVDVSNTGSAIYKNFQFIDVLPALNDSYILNSASPRGSAFNVNLSGNVSVVVNGVPSSGAIVEYSTSTTPQRFDAYGEDVAGDAWLPYTGSSSGAKALRVTLASGVNFNPGDKITLSFDATVPASAPRDGSTANNTIAYRFQTGIGLNAAAEAQAVPVKSTAPTGDTELSGQAFVDLDGDGIQGAAEPGLNGSGVSLQLYNMVSGNPVAVGSPVTPNADNGVDGVFSMIGLSPNATYKIKPISSNPNVTFPASAVDSNGFLIYSQVTDAAANGNQNTAQYVGSSSFRVGDAVGIAKWIKDIRLPLLTTTTVSGSLQLADVSNTPLVGGAGSAAAAYVAGFTVTLKQGSTKQASTTTNEAGQFSLQGIEGLTPGDYTLVFTSPSGRQLIGSGLNNPAVFSGAATSGAEGRYALNALQPGTGATGVNVYYTESTAPLVDSVSLIGAVGVGGTAYNPAAATPVGSDVGTEIIRYHWSILDAAATPAASGTALAGASIPIPSGLGDGAYTLVVTATDLVGNVSAEERSSFAVDRTAPSISSAASTATFVKGSPAAPTTAQGWIDLYGVTATDVGSGLASAGGITVDASAVDPTTAGTSSVTFTARDAVGNTSAVFTVTYTVAYVGDPSITLARNTAFLELGSLAPVDDAAWQELFGPITTSAGAGATVIGVAVDASAARPTELGSSPVLFTVTDSLGYQTVATGSLVVRDTTKPTITTTTNSLTFREGDDRITNDEGWIEAYGAVAADSGSGVKSLTVSASGVNYDAGGTYQVTFTAEDNAGNIQVATVTYTVAFAGAPNVVLGKASVTYEMGDTRPETAADWIDAFEATATTAAGTTLKLLTVDRSSVDFTTPSTGYSVTFTATDSYDNTFTSTGTYVVQDTTAPRVTVGTTTATHAKQQPEHPLTVADWLNLFDVSARDTTGGTGIDDAAWSVVEGVNFTVAGDYAVEFVAYDRAGNASQTATATLRIQAPPTSDVVGMDVAQNKAVTLDPAGRSDTTGSLRAITTADLGEPSAGGTLMLNSAGGVEYTPAQGFSGEETVSVTVVDDLGQTGLIVYTFNVVRAGALIDGRLPAYVVPVDGTVSIPNADILRAVDVADLSIEHAKTPNGFVGNVSKDGDAFTFATDGSAWSGEQTFTVTVTDALGQTVDVPVAIHVLAPSFSVDLPNGYAGTTELWMSATGLIPGKPYRIELHSTPLVLGTVTADANGAAEAVSIVPAAATAGGHQVVLLNEADQPRGSSAFEVLAVGGPGGGVADGKTVDQGATATTTTGQLSVTGTGGLSAAGATGLLVLLAGVFVLLWTRRRHETTTSRRS
ncbi:Ig-like domain-containing protein [Lysinibacter cavernae]|uniref:Putative repeat protein (TIGR01451 family) n=1 Tax=Lysinibacter cavernae TaxID=1640652 RepID=A0A7X5TT16_9MICO|nr:Ig-like domain-containing protein [Lysinibacter cavernae]NIH53665.1 putative repeat protein (TIGR01451 family) [Lysinibacter cavernae]